MDAGQDCGAGVSVARRKLWTTLTCVEDREQKINGAAKLAQEAWEQGVKGDEECEGGLTLFAARAWGRRGACRGTKPRLENTCDGAPSTKRPLRGANSCSRQPYPGRALFLSSL